jgi:CubicO group peptidase (beta-lactamase class C family)
MRSTRWVEAALALVIGVVALVVSGGALWRAFTPTIPVHENADSVPSTAAAAPADRYAGSVEESRRLARALIVGGNLPGLSVAVAVDGEIAWAEGFGVSVVESRTPVTPLTRFRLGALSKPLTAVAAALLHDQGRLDPMRPCSGMSPRTRRSSGRSPRDS